MSKLKIISLFFLLLFHSVPVLSGEIINSKVSFDQGVYKASIEMQINAAADKVYALFTDFNHLSRLSVNIRNSEIIDEDPPEYTVLVETHNCVLFFCVDLKQTQEVIELGDGYIVVEDIKDQSDFSLASSHWHIRAFEKGTRVTVYSEMQPDFWLPPIFGPWLFKSSLIEETQNIIEQLEKLAAHEQ